MSATPLSAAPQRAIPLSAAMLNAIMLEYKMNRLVNKFLSAGNKFMPEMHLKQPGFTYIACGPFTKKQRKNSKI